MTFASTRVWLNQGAASTEHVKAGVRANRSAEAATRATGLAYNRNPFVEDPHPSPPHRPTTPERNYTQSGYNTLRDGRQPSDHCSATTQPNPDTNPQLTETQHQSSSHRSRHGLNLGLPKSMADKIERMVGNSWARKVACGQQEFLQLGRRRRNPSVQSPERHIGHDSVFGSELVHFSPSTNQPCGFRDHRCGPRRTQVTKGATLATADGPLAVRQQHDLAEHSAFTQHVVRAARLFERQPLRDQGLDLALFEQVQEC